VGENGTLTSVGETLTRLPGLHGCLLAVRHESAVVGDLSDTFDVDGVRTLAAKIARSVEGSSVAPIQHVTLFTADGCISIFARGNAVLCALHRTRAFLPGVCEKLSAAVEALSEA
jgi:hypothetical protein